MGQLRESFPPQSSEMFCGEQTLRQRPLQPTRLARILVKCFPHISCFAASELSPKLGDLCQHAGVTHREVRQSPTLPTGPPWGRSPGSFSPSWDSSEAHVVGRLRSSAMLSSNGSHCHAARPCSSIVPLLPGLPLLSTSEPWDQLPQAPDLNPSVCLCF